MNKNTQILLSIVLVFAIFIGVMWQFYPLEDAKKRLNKLPLNGSAFYGKNVELSEFEIEFLKNVNVVKRLYRVGDQDLFISILDGTKNRHVVHDPYYCFTGSGWKIDDEKVVDIPKGQAVFLHISKNNEKKEAAFWFSDGIKNYDSPLKYWWETTLRRLSFGRSGNEPVLIVVQPLTESKLDLKELEQKAPILFTF